MRNRLTDWLFGRPLTKRDILAHRLRLCRLANISPEEVANFWVGIEELRADPKELQAAERRLGSGPSERASPIG